LFDATRSVDLLDRIGEGVFGLDRDGRFAYLNAPARRLLHGMFGLELPDPVGCLIWGQSPAIDAGPLGRALRRAAAEHLPVTAAVQDGRIKRGDLVLMEAMGGGFTWGAALVRW